jgi:ribosome-associated protein
MVGDPHESADVNRVTAAGEDDALVFACAVARIADAHKTENVAVLDLRGLSSLTNFFVLGTGTSDRQMNAVLDHVEVHAKSVQRTAFSVSNTRSTTWVLADYVDVIIHLFDAAHREYYDLDGLWGDAPRVHWRQAASAGNDESGE